LETIQQTELQALLRQMVEKSAGREMKTPRDFDFLSGIIYERTHENLSSFTLKRFWGYIDRGSASEATLSLLAKSIGYGSWEQFSRSVSPEADDESGLIVNTQLNVSSLRRGNNVVITWRPDRRIVACYKGMDLFTIVESANSKLPVGATFHCSLFVADAPLVMNCVVMTENSEPTSYVCGSRHGIQFHVN